MAAIRIKSVCTEFGATYAIGDQPALGALQALAMVSSGLADYVGNPPQTPFPDAGLVPITSVQFANPSAYGLNQWSARRYDFNGSIYSWGVSGFVGAGGVVTVAVANAEVLALNATPKQIIAAPGAGLAIAVHRAAVYKPAGAGFTVAAAKDLVLKYTNGSGAQVCSVIETTGFLDQATAQTRYACEPGATGATAGDVAPVANAAVVLHLLSGEITTGDQPLYVRVWYDIIQTAFTA